MISRLDAGACGGEVQQNLTQRVVPYRAVKKLFFKKNERKMIMGIED